MNPNGRTPSPLQLSNAQRVAALAKLGLSDGWLLLSVSEFYDLKKNMDGCSAENARLNRQTEKMLARFIVESSVADKALRSARALLVTIADRDAEPAMRFSALREVGWIDEALAIVSPESEKPKAEDPR